MYNISFAGTDCMLKSQLIRIKWPDSAMRFPFDIKIGTVLFLSFFLLRCSGSYQVGGKSGEEVKLPVLEFNGSADHIFTFTNKIAGFFVGHSLRENQNGFEGWTVNEFHYLKDYRIWFKGKPLDRARIRKFRYSPHQSERFYANGLWERFMLLDSLDAILVQITGGKDKQQIALQPILAQNKAGLSLRVDRDHPEIDIPAPVLTSSTGQVQDFHLRYLSGLNDTINFVFYLGKQTVSPDWIRNRIRKRKSRLIRLLAAQPIETDNRQVEQALLWARFALDALITRQRGIGIWAGLPWFNNYWGRDTFISFPGALLVSGRFDPAGQILRNFAAFQLKDTQNRLYGRIPNRITNREVIYNTADATWWFIRELYEYALYRGDRRTVQELIPTVRRAIEGALRYRTDGKGFLLHGAADTWMDAKGSQGAWSPRGNRAVEIQSLWYTALRVGALLTKGQSCSAKWNKQAEKVRENFNALFWDEKNQRLFDHLKANDQPDTSLRPNQIFAVTVPNLFGVAPLLDDDCRKSVVRLVTEKLTQPWGVMSLSPEDTNFHPWHHYEPYYVPDAAYHNGMIWTWLAGADISGLRSFGQIIPAAKLYEHESLQILDLDAIGNYSELLEPVLREGRKRPRISGTVSQAWSLAEFIRNFYRDFIGYQPLAIENRIILHPHLPPSMNQIHTRLLFKNSWIDLYLRQTEKDLSLQLKIDHADQTITGIFILPGRSGRSIEFTLNDSHRLWKRTFHRLSSEHPLSSWSLAPEIGNKTFPVIRRPEYVFLKGRDVFQSGPFKKRALIFKSDTLNDDRGPNGRYTYPENPVFKKGILDLKSFALYDLGRDWGFCIRLRNLTDPNWHPEYGFQLTFLAVAVQDESAGSKRTRKIGHQADYGLPAERAWNRIVYIGGGLEVCDAQGKRIAVYAAAKAEFPLGFPARNEIRFRLSKRFLKGLSKRSVISVLCGAQDDHGGSGIGDFRAVRKKRTEWAGGGADTDRQVPRIYDRLFVN